MPKPIDPYMASLARELDVVEAYRIHSQEGIEELMAITQGLLRRVEGKKKRREIVVRLLDHLDRLDKGYRAIAHELAAEAELEDRGQRWPGLFPPNATALNEGSEVNAQ